MRTSSSPTLPLPTWFCNAWGGYGDTSGHSVPALNRKSGFKCCRSQKRYLETQTRRNCEKPSVRARVYMRPMCFCAPSSNGEYETRSVAGALADSPGWLTNHVVQQTAFGLLRGDGQRFLQISELEKAAKNAANMDGETNMVSKLDLALATGNNATLFDNGGGENRIFESAQLAASLLSFQCFSPGGRIGLALWHEEETAGKRSSDHAPCLA